jgi:hypothetical protein
MPQDTTSMDAATLQTIREATVETFMAALASELAASQAAEREVTNARLHSKRAPSKSVREARQLTQITHLITLMQGQLKDHPNAARAAAQLRKAALLTRESAETARKARLARDRALHVLHVRYSVRKIDLYQPFGIGRVKLNRAFNEFSGKVPQMTQAQAWTAAREANKVYQHAKLVRDTAQAERDRLVAELARGQHDGVLVSGADLARLSGLTTARVSQLHTGSSNRARALKNAARRRAKAAALAAASSGDAARAS